MAYNATWSEHLVRRLVRLNGLKALNAEEAFFTRQDSPKGMSPTSSFTGWGTIVFRDKGADYRGGGLVTYSNLDIAVLFKNIQPVVWAYNPKTTREIAQELARQYGLPLDPNWFINEAFDYTTLPKSVLLKTNRTDFTNESVITVTVKRANADVNEIFSNVDLDYPQISFEPMTGRTNAEFSYHMDFTPDNLTQFKDLVNYPVEMITSESQFLVEPVQTLASFISTRLGLKTYFEVIEDLEAGDVCFKGSQLVYNGPARNYVHPENKPSSPKADVWYERVLVVRFDPTLSGWHGLAYFHYNELS